MKTIIKIRKLGIVFALLFSGLMYSQSYIETTYLDVPATKINRFVELHKMVVDMSQGEDRTNNAHWVYRHWYGSGESIVLNDIYSSSEDAIKDNFRGAFNKNIEALSEKEKNEMQDVFSEWWSFFQGHWDELRVINFDKYFLEKENVDWDQPFVLVVGHYNSYGSLSKMGDAYMDWQIKPGVNEGLMMGGGVSVHYKGSGSDVQFFSSYENIMDFAKSVSSQGSDNAEARKTFWNMVSGSHKDQIYVHIGHTEEGKFNLAGKDK